MGELGEIGWYLKLESLTGSKITGIGVRKERQKDKLKQPLFQFRYEPQNGRFIRELRDNLFTDNACKNPNFVNG